MAGARQRGDAAPARPPAEPCAGERTYRWPGERASLARGRALHVVTGKGGTGKTTVAAALALALAAGGRRDAARRGRGPAGHRPAVRHRRRCRTRSAGSPSAPRRRRGLRAGRRRRGGAARVPRHVLQPARGRPGAAQDGRDRLRHHDRAGPARRAAHRQGQGGGHPHAAGRPASTTRSCSTRRRPAGSPGSSTSPPRSPGWPRSGPIKTPERRRDGGAALAADRGAPGHAAGGDAGAGDRRRGRRSCARPGCRSARCIVNMARQPLLPEPALAARPRAARPARSCAAGLAAAGLPTPTRGRRRAGRRGRRARPSAGAGRTRCATSARRARPADGRAAAPGRRRSTSAACTSWPSRSQAASRARRVTARHAGRPAPTLDVDALLADPETRIIVCCGSGGVGKTTTAAALGAARRRARAGTVVVLTIDPARRLAQSLGLTELDNTPRAVAGVDGGRRRAARDDAGHEADVRRGRRRALRRRSGPSRSSPTPSTSRCRRSFAGTQEYMAMEKLGQLRASDEWDLIVVDTPPSPVGAGLPGRPEPAGPLPRRPDDPAADRAGAGRRPGVPEGRQRRRSGCSAGRAHQDPRRRAAAATSPRSSARWTRCSAASGSGPTQTYELLQAPGTAFVVVAAPEPDALREASYFVERLSAERMPLAGLVLNRVAPAGGDGAVGRPGRRPPPSALAERRRARR